MLTRNRPRSKFTGEISVLRTTIKTSPCDGLSWKEELADLMFRSKSRKYPKKYRSSSQKSWPTQRAWNKDRADFKQLFAFIDWDQDGVITAAEDEAFNVQIKTYHDGAYPKKKRSRERLEWRSSSEWPSRSATKSGGGAEDVVGFSGRMEPR